MILHALIAIAAQAQLADLPPPTEEMRGLYYAPPASEHTEAAFKPDPDASVFTLANQLNSVDDALSGCETMRKEMTSLIKTDFGSYAVHPDWLEAYQTCLLTRDEEIKSLGKTITSQRASLLEGLDSEQAMRVTDFIARLTVYQTKLKGRVTDEVAAQKDFVELYNSGGNYQPLDLE